MLPKPKCTTQTEIAFDVSLKTMPSAPTRHPPWLVLPALPRDYIASMTRFVVNPTLGAAIATPHFSVIAKVEVIVASQLTTFAL